MLLQELFAKDIDLSEYDKKIMVNIKLADEKGLNIKSLYTLERNPANLKSAKEMLVKYKFIQETNQKDFYIITDTGHEAMSRASLIDDNNELIDAHTSKYIYEISEDSQILSEL